MLETTNLVASPVAMYIVVITAAVITAAVVVPTVTSANAKNAAVGVVADG